MFNDPKNKTFKFKHGVILSFKYNQFIKKKSHLNKFNMHNLKLSYFGIYL